MIIHNKQEPVYTCVLKKQRPEKEQVLKAIGKPDITADVSEKGYPGSQYALYWTVPDENAVTVVEQYGQDKPHRHLRTLLKIEFQKYRYIRGPRRGQAGWEIHRFWYEPSPSAGLKEVDCLLDSL